MRRKMRILCVTALGLSLPWCAALAGGGFSEPGFVDQSQKTVTAEYSQKGNAVAANSVTITASSDVFTLASTTGIKASAGPSSGKISAWNTTAVQTQIESNVVVDTTNTVVSFAKGSNSLGVGKSATEASIVINGKTYVVAQELAIALARSTQFGSSAAVEVDGMLSLPGGGVSTAPVAANKPVAAR